MTTPTNVHLPSYPSEKSEKAACSVGTGGPNIALSKRGREEFGEAAKHGREREGTDEGKAGARSSQPFLRKESQGKGRKEERGLQEMNSSERSEETQGVP